MSFSAKFKTIAAAKPRVLKQRPDATLTELQKRTTVPVNVHRQSNKKLNPEHKGKNSWWDDLSLKGQEEHLRRHPHSKKRISKTEQGHHVTPRDPEPKDGHREPPKITYYKPTYVEDGKIKPLTPEREKALVKKANKQRQEEANKLHKLIGGKKNGYSKSVMFLNRLTSEAPPLASASATKAQRNKAQEAFSKFMSKYDKMSAEDFEDEADRHYAANPDHAKEDGVNSESDLHSTDQPMNLDDTDEDVEQAKETAENSAEPANPTIIENVEKQFKENPFGKLPPKEQKEKVKKAVKVLAKGFSADTNSILAHAYKNLDADQINMLEDIAQDAAKRNMMNKKKQSRPAKTKAFLKIVGVTIMVGAALAFGGPMLGALAFHHSLTIAHPEGNLDEVIWNALRGKLANGKDDPNFDPHEDAVEKIVKSLKRQLAATDQDQPDTRDHLKAIIEQLESSTDHHAATKDDYISIPSHTRRRKVAYKPKAKPAIKKKKH